MVLYFRLMISFICCLLWVPSTHAEIFTPEGDIIGEADYYTVKEGDTLYKIARKYDLGIVELLAANSGVDPWTPKVGTELTLTKIHILPDVKEGIVLNLSELRLFYFLDDGSVMSFPIGIGREGWLTPIGETSIAKKRRDPTWTPTASIRKENPALPDVIPAGPNNPLGQYALNLDWPSYAIHGTNRPNSVGTRSSHGCIRLYSEDIETLFHAVEVSTPVTIVDMPFKLGWQRGELFLEVTPTQVQTDAIVKSQIPHVVSIPEIYDAIRNIAEEKTIDWYQVEDTIKKRTGIPSIISK